MSHRVARQGSICLCEHSIILVAQMVKNLPAMQETQLRSLGQEDPLERGMATYSSIVAWRIPWTKEAGGLQSVGSQRVRHNWVTNTSTFSLSGHLTSNSLINRSYHNSTVSWFWCNKILKHYHVKFRIPGKYKGLFPPSVAYPLPMMSLPAS